MAITREKKEQQIQELTEELRQSKMTVLVDYSGMNVKQAQELRKQVKQKQGNFRVVKNAMFTRAAANAFDGLDMTHLEGPVAIASGYDDPVMPAKEVVDYAKKNEVLAPLGAIDETGQLFSADEVQKLAALPSREELAAQLVGTIAAPLSGFVNVLNGNLRGLVTVLDGIAQAKE